MVQERAELLARRRFDFGVRRNSGRLISKAENGKPKAAQANAG
jgi:hypothetical protein